MTLVFQGQNAPGRHIPSEDGRRIPTLWGLIPNEYPSGHGTLVPQEDLHLLAHPR